MIWRILDRAGTIAYLVLSTILITILMNNSSETAGSNNYAQKLTLLQQELTRVITNNTNYLEARVNKTSERQDDYQVTADQRMYVLEQKVLQLQNDKKSSNKIFNSNTNINTNIN